MQGRASRSSSSTVGYGGVVGGDEGERELEEVMAASGELGRRRFDVACVGRANVDPLSANTSASSLSDPVSSMSSRFWIGVAPGKRSRLERGVACCVAGFSKSVAGFWVEPKLNFGAALNC